MHPVPQRENASYARHRALLLLALILVAAICRIPKLTRGLGQDELFTAVHFVEVRPVYRTLTSNLAFNNHVGYSVMARISEFLLGRSEWTLRFPALLLGLATVPLVFYFGESVAGTLPASLAALLLGLSPTHVYWSTQARGYSGLIFFTLLATVLYFRLLKRPERRSAGLYVAAASMAAYMHLYAVFALLMQAVFLARPAESYQGRRVAAKCLTAVAGITALLYLPVTMQVLRDVAGRGSSRFDPMFPWAVLKQFSGNGSPVIAVLMLLVAGIGYAAFSKQHGGMARFLLAWLAVPLALMWVLRPYDLYTRFFAYWLPYYLLFFSSGVTVLWSAHTPGMFAGVARPAAAVAAGIVICSFALDSASRTPDEGYREVVRAVTDGAGPDTTFCAIGSARSVWQYYVRRPVLIPKSLDEFRALAQGSSDVRCFYYGDMEPDSAQTPIAQFLLRNAKSTTVNGLTGFIFNPEQRGATHAKCD